jgi:hypothetical protein
MVRLADKSKWPSFLPHSDHQQLPRAKPSDSKRVSLNSNLATRGSSIIPLSVPIILSRFRWSLFLLRRVKAQPLCQRAIAMDIQDVGIILQVFFLFRGKRVKTLRKIENHSAASYSKCSVRFSAVSTRAYIFISRKLHRQN